MSAMTTPRTPASLNYTLMESPLGEVLIAGDERGLYRIIFQGGTGAIDPPAAWQRDDRALGDAVDQLNAYFAGELREFDLPLVPRGTDFQLQVWRALQVIPYGETRSYADLAVAIGRPTATRAVGAANGRNPLPIIIPCHRVIGASGELTGYHGGLHLKKGLLRIEGVATDARLEAPSFI
jgi:methylated-DNA-[protein]-cysteine S-methyltransferase